MLDYILEVTELECTTEITKSASLQHPIRLIGDAGECTERGLDVRFRSGFILASRELRRI